MMSTLATDAGVSRRRLLRLALVISLLIGAGFGICVIWLRDVAEPPAVDLADIDPAVQKAIREAAEQIRQKPRSAAAWGKLGMILFNQKLAAASLTCFANAERLDAKDARWPYHQALILMADDPPSALPKMTQAAKLPGGRGDRPRLRLAELYMQLGRFDDGRKELEALLEGNPSHPRVNLALARVYAQAGELDRCRERLPAALAHPLTRKAAQRLSAEVHQRSGDVKAAQRDLAQAQAALLPDDPDWPDEILEETQLLAVGEARDIGQANKLLDRQQVREATSLLQRVVQDYPQSARGWLLLGYAQMNLRQYSEAEASLQTALKLSPDSASALLNLGTLHELRNDRPAAIGWYRKAIEQKPDFLSAYLRLGACLKAVGDRTAAIDAFRDALRCQPLSSVAHAQLGELLLQENQRDQALSHLQQAVDLNPNDAAARKLLETARAQSSSQK